MKKKQQIFFGLVISLVLAPLLLVNFSVPVKADTYKESSVQNREYVYNVTQWDQELNWYFGMSYKGQAKSNPGGIIRVSFTGFFDYVPNSAAYEPTNVFNNTVPFINISFYERFGSSLVGNLALTNISSAEAAYVTALGYREFNPGFLIPTDNLTRLEERVFAQNVSGGWVDYRGNHSFQNLTDTVKISFRQNTGGQNTTLIYNKTTGVLLWAKVESVFGPDFEIELTSSMPKDVDIYSTSFDIDKEYVYNVTQWDSQFTWYFGSSNKGTAFTNPGGKIQVTYTGFYDYTPGGFEPENEFKNAIPFIDLNFYEESASTLIKNISLANISTVEAASAMAFGYRHFNPGFLIPTDNFTRLKERVLAQDVNDTYVNYQGDHSCEELADKINITFKQNNPDSNAQNVSLLYDKESGALLWAMVRNSLGPDFEIELLSSITDVYAPEIEITAPTLYTTFAQTAPNFTVSIEDFPLPKSGQVDKMWYNINNGKNITFTANGRINQTLWNALSDGDVTITFYANDTAGNLASESVTVKKDTSTDEISTDEIPGYSLMICIPIAVISILGIVLIHRKRTSVQN